MIERCSAEIRETDEAVLFVSDGAVILPDVFHWPMSGEQIGGNQRRERDHLVDAPVAGRPYVMPVKDALAAMTANDAMRASRASGKPEVVDVR